MRVRLSLLAMSLGGLVAAGLALGAEEVAYLKVVTQSDKVVGNGRIEYLTYDYCLEHDRVTFVADAEAGRAIFATERGKTRMLVESGTSAPGLGGEFEDFYEVVQDQGVILFIGATEEQCDPWNCVGVFLEDDSGLDVVAHTKMKVPGHNQVFSSFGGLALEGGLAAFQGLVHVEYDPVHGSQAYGIWADRGQGLETVADWTTPVPGTQKTMRVNDMAGISDNKVYFSAYYSEEGQDDETYLFAWDGESLETIIGPDTIPPGQSEPMKHPYPFAVRDGTLAFVDEAWDPEAETWQYFVYADFGSGLEQIMNEADLFERFGVLVGYIDRVSVSGDTVAIRVHDYLTGDDYVFAYRDGQLYKLISEGDMLRGFLVESLFMAPQAVSDDAVLIFLADESYGSNTGYYKAVVGNTEHRILVTGDLDGNERPEIVLRTIDEYDHEYRLQIRDLSSSGMSSYFKLGAEPIVDMAVFDRQAGGKRVATLVHRDNGRTAIRIWNAKTGRKLFQIDVGTGMTPRSLALFPDINGNGEPELAAMGVLVNGAARIRIYDSSSKTLLSKFTHYSSMDPLRLLTIVDAGPLVPVELGLLLYDTSQTRSRMVIYDAWSGVMTHSLVFRQGFKPVGISAVADQNENRYREVAFVGYRPSDGKAMLQIKDAWTGKQTARSTWKSAGNPVEVSVTPEGDQVMVLEVQSDGTSTVRLRAAADAKALGKMQLSAVTDAIDLAGTPDTNRNGTADVAVLGEHFNLGLVEVCDGMSRKQIRYMFVP